MVKSICQLNSQLQSETWEQYEMVGGRAPKENCPTWIGVGSVTTAARESGAGKNGGAIARVLRERKNPEYKKLFAKCVKWLEDGRDGVYLFRCGLYTAAADAWKQVKGTEYHYLRKKFEAKHKEWREDLDTQYAMRGKSK